MSVCVCVNVYVCHNQATISFKKAEYKIHQIDENKLCLDTFFCVCVAQFQFIPELVVHKKCKN